MTSSCLPFLHIFVWILKTATYQSQRFCALWTKILRLLNFATARKYSFDWSSLNLDGFIRPFTQILIKTQMTLSSISEFLVISITEFRCNYEKKYDVDMKVAQQSYFARITMLSRKSGGSVMTEKWYFKFICFFRLFYI